MKKIFCFCIVFILICTALVVFSFAAYTYPSPPGKDVSWDFSSDKAYTIKNCYDILYYRGSNGFLGIGKKNSSVEGILKEKNLYFAVADVGIQSSDGTFLRTFNRLPETISKSFTAKQSSNNPDPAQFVRYDAKYYQLNGNNLINITEYVYMSEEGLVVG